MPAAVLHVPSQYPTIQNALMNAQADDTVLVAPGIYYEDIVWPNTNGIDLVSEKGADSTVIDALASGSVITINADVDSGTVIKGFAITNGRADFGGGICCNAGDPSICDNAIFADTARYYGGGIYCAGADNNVGRPRIRNNFIADNCVFDGSGGGICCYQYSAPVIIGNSIKRNHADNYWGGGIHCECPEKKSGSADQAAIYIYANAIDSNTANLGGGLSLFNPFVDIPTIDSNEIKNNAAQTGGGIAAYWTLGNITRNDVSDNSAVLYGGGISAEECHEELVIRDCRIAQNRVTEHGGGIAFIFWSFYPRVIRDSIVENQAGTGAGIYCYYFSSPYVDSAVIANNHALYEGGGIYCQTACSLTVVNSRITGNTAMNGGGILMQEATCRITGCGITSNGLHGIYFRQFWQSAPQVHCSNLYDNTGLSVYSIDNSVIFNAEYNWWGDSTGPYHDSLNPSGLGDTVSDYVDFIPWLYGPYGIDGPRPGPILSPSRNLHCYPNPFSNLVTIGFSRSQPTANMGSSGSLDLKVYDAAGRVVKAFSTPHYYRSLNNYQFAWDGCDDHGQRLPGGVYFIVMRDKRVNITAKVVKSQ